MFAFFIFRPFPVESRLGEPGIFHCQDVDRIAQTIVMISVSFKTERVS
jgi:hypothetical protein